MTTNLVLLGTAGGPPLWHGSARRGISSAVVVGDLYYLVDAGYGVLDQIVAAGLGNWTSDDAGPLDALRGIFITHLHSDHIVDLTNLILLGLSNGLPFTGGAVPIWGPGDRGALPRLFGTGPAPDVVSPAQPTPGTREMVDLLVRAFATDYNDRARDVRRPTPDHLFQASNVPIPLQFIGDPNGEPEPRMSPVTFFEDDRVRVSATLVQHAPVFPALAYRFDSEDGSVVFSGDTAPSENLIELATDADVLVHEVIDREWVESRFPNPRSDADESKVAHHLGAHTLVDQVGPVADRAGVRTLVLSHLVPGHWPVEKWRQAGDHFSGELIVGRDLDVIRVKH